MAFKSPLDQASNLIKTQKFAGATSPQLKHKSNVYQPDVPADVANYFWHRQYKGPKDLVNQVNSQNEHINNLRKTITPLDEFKRYEDFMYSGPDFQDDQTYFGAPFHGEGSKYSVAYPKLLEAYGKTRGVHAKSIDPEVQKYFNDRMAYRQGLFDRVNKVPEDKWQGFAYGYGPFSDPFDFEGDESTPITRQEFLDSFDYDASNLGILEDYLKERGY